MGYSAQVASVASEAVDYFPEVIWRADFRFFWENLG